MRLSQTLVVSGCCVMTLTGCGMFSDHSRDYQRAASIAPLVLPEGIKSQPLEPLYTIPRIAEQDVSSLDLGTGEAPRPEPLSKNSEEAKVKIQKVGNKRWILVDASSSQIWPLTQSFLAGNSITLAKTQPTQGIIETSWIGLKADPTSKNRFRIAIEQGVHADTAEVHVLHQQVALGQEQATTAWPSESSAADREAWLLDELSRSLADSVNNRAASLLGQTVGGDIKAGLIVVAGEPVLRLHLSPERAAASLARAVNSEGFVNWGRLANANVFYVGYQDQANPPGWFKRVFLRAKAAAPAKPRYPAEQVIQHLANTPEVQRDFANLPGVGFGEALKKAEGYWLQLTTTGQHQLVHVRNARGERLSAQEAKQLLSILRRNLI